VTVMASPKAPERGEYLRVWARPSGRALYKLRLVFGPADTQVPHGYLSGVFEGLLDRGDTVDDLRQWISEHFGRPVEAVPSADVRRCGAALEARTG
jgi:hypothetical protein